MDTDLRCRRCGAHLAEDPSRATKQSSRLLPAPMLCRPCHGDFANEREREEYVRLRLLA